MELIEDWFAKKADRAKEIISIYEGILSKDFYVYIFFRLQYFLYTTLIKTGIRAAEFYFLFYFVTSDASINIVLFRMLGLTLSGLWWGILESLRTQLRLDRKNGEREKLPITVQYWLTLSFCVAAGVLFLGVLLIVDAWTLQQLQLSRLEYFYVGAILIQLAASIVASTVHSSIFALTRISRPLLSVSLAQILGLIFLVVLYPFTDEYTLAIVFVIEGFITVAMMLYYTLRMDRVLMLLPKAVIRWQGFLSFLKTIATKELFFAGLASLLFALQPLFIYLIIEEGPDKLTYPMAMLIFLIAPQINETFNWTHLFYFDMKKLAQPGLRRFELYMHAKLKVVALLVGLGAWVISAMVITLFYPRQFFIPTLLLLPIYLVRSWNAHKEMQLFCEFNYLNNIVGGLIFALLSGVIFAVFSLTVEVLPFSLGITYNLIVILGLFLLCTVFLTSARPISDFKQNESQTIFDFYSWLFQTKNLSQPTIIFYIQLADRSKGKFEYILARALSEYGLVASPGAARLLVAWKVNASDSVNELYAKIVSMAAGHIVRIQRTDVCPNGTDAVLQGISNGFLPTPNEVRLSEVDLVDYFKAQFPDGQFVTINAKENQSHITLPTTSLFGSLTIALKQHFRSPYELGYFKGYYVAASVRQAQILNVFLLPENKVDRSEAIEWKNYLLSHNV